jgi:hypothetical protein
MPIFSLPFLTLFISSLFEFSSLPTYLERGGEGEGRGRGGVILSLITTSKELGMWSIFFVLTGLKRGVRWGGGRFDEGDSEQGAKHSHAHNVTAFSNPLYFLSS